jgi:hypothetical protein
MVAAATRVAGRPARGMDEVSSPPHPQPGGVADYNARLTPIGM